VFFVRHHPSLTAVTPKCPSRNDIPCLEAANATGGQTLSARFGRLAALPGWILAKQLFCAHFGLINRRAFSSMGLAAALFFAGILSIPASAHASQSLYVTTLADVTDASPDCTSYSGNTCSLRDAIAIANADNAGDGIGFLQGLGGTIKLSTAYPYTNTLVITGSMTIMGPGANALTVSGENGTTVFAITGGTVNISGLTIANGSANYKGAGNGGVTSFGGGIYLGAGTLTLNYCAILNNSAAQGGGIYQSTGTLTVNACTIAGNAAGFGAAIYNNDTNNNDSLEVYNSTITGNSASQWGGAIFNDGHATVVASTITGNTGDSQSAGIYNADVTTITDSIVAGNITGGVANTGDCVYCSTQSANNLIGGVPPALGPLAWNGGSTQTMIPLFGSSAIGKGTGTGTNQYVPGYYNSSDQRGFQRATSGAIDLGAVQTHYLTVNTNADSDDGSCAAICSLRDAMNQANTDKGGDIRFTTTGSIQLLSGSPLPMMDSPMNITGPGPSLLTVDGLGSTSVGSIFVNAGMSVISGLTITGGTYKTGGGGAPGGGAIQNIGVMTLVNSVITGNTSSEFGGGIDNQGSFMRVTGSTISGNSVTGSGVGGGIFSVGILFVEGSTISGNTSSGRGGGLYLFGASATLINSTIAGNSASDAGGFYYNCLPSSGYYCTTVTAVNTTISGNTAGSAGGIDNGTGGSNVLLLESIVAGNTTGGTANSGDCISCGTQSYDNLIGGDPQLSPLQLNGAGTTLQTMIPLPDSPAIGSGYVLFLTPDQQTDERGFPRSVGQFGGAIDVGAVQTNYTKIVFIKQPSDSIAGKAISPAITAEVLEENTSDNSIDAVNGVPIILGFSGDAGAIANASSLTATTANGVATFGNIIVTEAGTGYYFGTSLPMNPGSKAFTNDFNVTGVSVNLSPSTLPSGTVGSVYNQTISATGGTAPYAYTLTSGSLPAGLSLNSSTGVVSGTPNASGAFPITINAADSSAAPGPYSASQSYSLTIAVEPVAATPTFSPIAGAYTSAQTVTISDATTGATIYYTTDGVTTPTTSSTKYTGAITVSASETIQAIAVAAGYTNSAVASATYAINLPAAVAPTFSPTPGTYQTSQQITIADTTPGASIYYTTNYQTGVSTTPTASSTPYTGPFWITGSQTILAMAVAPGYSNSAVSPATYSIIAPTAPAPTFSPAPGSFTSAQTVTISDSGSNPTIFYTTDGTVPTMASTKYTGPITVSSTETIQAVAAVLGDYLSPVASGTFTINLPQVAAPHFSIGTGTYSSAQTITLTDATAGATIYYTTDGSTPTANSNLADGPITVSSTETITAIAITGGDTNSEVVWATYTINPAAPDFAISATNASATLLQGSPAVFNLAVTPLNSTAFSASLTLAATGLPTGATAVFSPASIASGAGSTPVTMTIQAPKSAAMNQPAGGSIVGKLTPFSLALFLLPIVGRLRKAGKRFSRMVTVLLLLFAGAVAMTGLSGCGSTNGFFGQMPKAYTVTITGSMGTVSHSTTTILIVQ
jgi:CSLREA domain-containing protein